MKTCHKCNGNGVIKGFEHIDNGVCYNCNGTGEIRNEIKKTKPQFTMEEPLSKHELEVIRYFREPLNFGKHKGKMLTEVDDEYLRWLYTTTHNYALREAVMIIYGRCVEEFEDLKRRWKNGSH